MAPTRKIKIFVLQSVLISLLVIFVEALSVEPYYAQYGKRFICTNQNGRYVESSACNIKLLNRTYQLNNLSVIFHPNVTLNNAYVRFFQICFSKFIQSIYYLLYSAGTIHYQLQKCHPLSPNGFTGTIRFMSAFEDRWHDFTGIKN